MVKSAAKEKGPAKKAAKDATTADTAHRRVAKTKATVKATRTLQGRPEAKKAQGTRTVQRQRASRKTAAKKGTPHTGNSRRPARNTNRKTDEATESENDPSQSDGNEEEDEECAANTESESQQSASVEQTQRYTQWFTFPQQAGFLAQAERALLRACCRTLPRLTVSPASSSAFLAVARHGATPPSSPTSHNGEGGDGAPVAATAAVSADAQRPLSSDHEDVYRTVRNTIAASCALGHRSCQAVWGPRGSGKHRLVRLVAQECAAQPNTLVVQLDGGLLNGDEDAIRSIAQQMLSFLLSPQSAALRAADWSIRTGTFDFGRLFRFDRAMAEAGLGDADEKIRGGGDDYFAVPAGKSKTGAAAKRRKRSLDNEEEEDGSEAESVEEEAFEGPFITTTTGNLVGGAASALPPLQRALLLMKHNNVNLIVCVSEADRFGIWCDQLLYVLAGLMHESDGQGGGMSLLLTSSAPDLRQMEKRLSSRLTGETRFVPLLPWTPRRMLRALLVVVKELAECAATITVAGEAAEPVRRGKRTARAPADERAEQQRHLISQLSPAWQERIAALELILPLDAGLFAGEALGGGTGIPNEHVNRDERRRQDANGQREGGEAEAGDGDEAEHAAALRAHPTLFLEAIAVLCHDVLQQLNASTNKLKHKQGTAGSGGGGSSSAAHAQTLVRHIQELNEDLCNTGATAESVMAAVVNCLCKTAAGAFDSLGVKGRHRVLAWLDRRQGQELAWPWKASTTAVAESRASAVPALIRQRWDAVVGVGNANYFRPLASVSPHVPVAVPLPPDLFDLLDGGKLVQLGYASRETVQVLFNMLLQDDNGVRGRSIADLLEDVTSALGTRAAAAVDKTSYRAAIRQLCRWHLLRVTEDSELVSLCGSANRLRDFLHTVLEHRADWCESGVLGLDAKDFMRMRSLV